MTIKLLDAFCGVGGATRGYQLAGFHVTGVDIARQGRYIGDAFVQGDAIAFIREHGHEFDAIHASPPCQAYSKMKYLPNQRPHPDLISPTREAILLHDVPYVIENVPGSPLSTTVILCGSMFGLRSDRGYLRRHRLFESNILLTPPGPCRHEGLAIGVYGHGSAGHTNQRMRTANADEARILMGMPWSHRNGLSQAIPPAYTEHLGEQLMQWILATRGDRVSPDSSLRTV